MEKSAFQDSSLSLFLLAKLQNNGNEVLSPGVASYFTWVQKWRHSWNNNQSDHPGEQQFKFQWGEFSSLHAEMYLMLLAWVGKTVSRQADAPQGHWGERIQFHSRLLSSLTICGCEESHFIVMTEMKPLMSLPSSRTWLFPRSNKTPLHEKYDSAQHTVCAW